MQAQLQLLLLVLSMNRTDKTYIVLHSKEKERLKEALRMDYSDEGRISLGAYVRTLAERRIAQNGGEHE